MLTRALIVLLLVLNLGVAAWWMTRPVPTSPSLPAQPAGMPRLQLLSEAPARRVASVPAPPVPVAEPVAPPPEAETTRCFAIGPFADPAQARALLQPRVQRLVLRQAPQPASSGPWNVSMPPQADRAAAQVLATRIAAAGFNDYYIVAEGEQANAIALGRFGTREGATRHQAALQAAGFDARVQPPPAAATQAWLDVAVAPGFDPATLLPRLGGAQARPVDCATLG